MCYEKPGKRCASHASESLEAKHERVERMSAKYDTLLSEGNQTKIDAYAADLREAMQLEMKAQIDYDATDTGMEELYDMKEELVMVGSSTQEITRRIDKAQARAAWQVNTYNALKEIENADGFGKIYALEDALRYASVELEVEKERQAVAERLHEGAKQQLAELAVKDLTSYIKSTEKKISEIKSTNDFMRRLGEEGMKGKKFISMPSESE